MTHLSSRLRDSSPVVQDGERPLYARVLRLRHLEPGKLACSLFFEGSIVLAMLLAFTDLVSWYGVLALPVTVAVMVKFNDVVAGRLPDPHAPRRPLRARGPAASAPDGVNAGRGGQVGSAADGVNAAQEDLEDDDITAALGFIPVRPMRFEETETTRLSRLRRDEGPH